MNEDTVYTTDNKEDDSDAILWLFIIVALLAGLIFTLYLLASAFEFLQDASDEANYTYQSNTVSIVSYDFKYKKADSFIQSDKTLIYTELANGQTKIYNSNDIYVKAGTENELVEIKPSSKQGQKLKTEYVFVLDKDTYAIFNKEFAITFNEEVKEYTNDRAWEKAAID